MPPSSLFQILLDRKCLSLKGLFFGLDSEFYPSSVNGLKLPWSVETSQNSALLSESLEPDLIMPCVHVQYPWMQVHKSGLTSDFRRSLGIHIFFLQPSITFPVKSHTSCASLLGVVFSALPHKCKMMVPLRIHRHVYSSKPCAADCWFNSDWLEGRSVVLSGLLVWWCYGTDRLYPEPADNPVYKIRIRCWYSRFHLTVDHISSSILATGATALTALLDTPIHSLPMLCVSDVQSTSCGYTVISAK